MRVESCRSQRPVRSRRGRTGLLLIVAFLFFSPWAVADTLLMMRAVCDGSLITDGESPLPGYEEFVQLSSVHHDLEAPAAPDLSTQERMRLTSFRIAKVFSGSSVLMIRAMAQARRCQEIRIDNLLQDPGSGQRVLRWQLVLQNAYVTARKEWSAGGGELPQDSFGFIPESLDWTYFLENGSPGPTFSWQFNTTPARQ